MAVVVGGLLLGWTGQARAQAAREAAQRQAERLPGDWMRPITWASVEVNPLATLAGRWGGQATVGLVGPVSFAAGVARVSDPGSSPRYSAYEEGVVGSPGVHGTSYEAGARLHLPILRAPNGLKLDVYLAPSYVYDTLEQDGDMECTFVGERSPTHCALGPRRHAKRYGLAVDGAAQVTFPFGLYFTAGFGHTWSTITPGLVRRSEGWAVRPARVAMSEHVPRLLFSVGWGI